MVDCCEYVMVGVQMMLNFKLYGALVSLAINLPVPLKISKRNYIYGLLSPGGLCQFGLLKDVSVVLSSAVIIGSDIHISFKCCRSAHSLLI